MKRFLILSGILWLSLTFWSSNSYALTANSVAEAITACQARTSQHTYGTHPDSCEVTPGQWSGYWNVTAYECPDFECSFRMKDVDWTNIHDPSYEPPPECVAPNYIDTVSGECVPPTEVCYTNLESMADQCVLIGDADGDGLNCVTNETGLELCLGDNPLCYEANGKTVCPEPDSVCGEKNGAFSCVNPMEEGCGLFNGEKVCFTTDGDKVEPDSPDHPDNGGNLDGDDTNDVTDSRDPTEGGDPNNQPGESDTSSTDAASEKTARDSLNKLRDIEKGISGVKSAVEQGVSSLKEEGNSSQVEGIAQDIANTPIAGLQDHEDGIGLNPLDGDAADGVGNSVTGLVQQGSCTELGFNFNGHAFGLPCDKTQKIRDMLSWVLYFLTVWMLFEIVTSPVVRRA